MERKGSMMMEEVLKQGINLIAGGSWDLKLNFCAERTESRLDTYSVVELLRRERNRVLARKTRLRKKSFFEVRLQTYSSSESCITVN